VNEYIIEGISRFVPQAPYFDNAECIRLLQNIPGGLIHIMDDQARLGRQPKKTDHAMVEGWGCGSGFPSLRLVITTAPSHFLEFMAQTSEGPDSFQEGVWRGARRTVHHHHHRYKLNTDIHQSRQGRF
jgi:chitin synthase